MADDKPKLLIVEDDPGLQKQLKWCFDDYEVIAATDRPAALAALRRHEPAVVLQDLGLPPDAEGVSEGFATLLETLQAVPRDTKVIVVTGQLDKQNAVKAVGMGAYDFYQKPVDTDVLRLLVQRAFHIHALEDQNRALIQRQGVMPLAGLIAISEPMMKVCRTIEKVAPTNATVLLLGESGTGKEVLARAVHAQSPRAEKPFVAINCAAIPDTCSKANCSATRRAPSPAPSSRPRASSSTRTAARCSSTRSATCRSRCRPSCCGSCRTVSSNASVAATASRWTCASSARPTRTCRTLIKDGGFREDLYYRISEVTVAHPAAARPFGRCRGDRAGDPRAPRRPSTAGRSRASRPRRSRPSKLSVAG